MEERGASELSKTYPIGMSLHHTEKKKEEKMINDHHRKGPDFMKVMVERRKNRNSHQGHIPIKGIQEALHPVPHQWATTPKRKKERSKPTLTSGGSTTAARRSDEEGSSVSDEK